jgi:hypothetical protein
MMFGMKTMMIGANLRKPFEFGALGSKIIVTARNDGVSSTMGATQPYKLKELSNDACLTCIYPKCIRDNRF